MAVVQNPFMSGKARGSVGGLTASRCNVGAVMKAKAHPPTRVREFQPKIRSILGWCARRYGELTADQRDQWEAYATNHPYPDGFGGTFILTPEQMYLALNIIAVRWFGYAALQTSPPAEPPVASCDNLTGGDGAASGDVNTEVTLLGTGSADDKIIFMRAGPFQSKGRVEVHNRFRKSVYTAGNVLLYPWYGLVPEMWYWFRARYIDQYGQKTNWVYFQWQAPTI